MNINETSELKNISEKNQLKGVILAIIAAVMWGIMGIFVRGLSSAGYSSYDISFMRCILAGGIYFIIKAITNPKILKIDAKGLAISAFYGVFAYALAFMTYGISVTRVPVAVATVLMFMSPVWVSILGVIVFKEKLSTKTILTILVCLTGASMVSNLFESSGNMDAIGIITGILNGFCVALQLLIPKYFAKNYERDTILVYGFLSAGILLAFFTDFQGILHSFSGESSLNNILNVLGLGIFCTMVANISFVKASAYIPATTCSVLSALEVIISAIFGFILFKENLSVVQILGAVIIITGLLGPSLLKNKKQPKVSEVSQSNTI